ncbi:hypothetical protein ACIP5Z_00575 [Rothia terrae]|nr:hypothetical protein [Rothia terrae]MDT0189101.1 hypothetical protein [Rothia terrae]
MLQVFVARFFAFLATDDDSERGDVPGWVMITMMTAILVAALLVVAQDALVAMFQNAMAKVSG